MQTNVVLAERLRLAVNAAFDVDVAPEVSEATSQDFGDYQTNIAMQLRDVLPVAPRNIAQEIVRKFSGEPIVASVTIAGPGFINFHLDPDWIAHRVGLSALDPRLGVEPVDDRRRVVVDFSSPNVAKRMHVGHLRSTIIGDAIIRILRFLGYEVVGDNHVGDWGTQFGVLLWGWKNLGNQDAFEKDAIEELERVYRETEVLRSHKPDVNEACRKELAALQAGRADQLALWNLFVAASRQRAEEVYAQLDVAFELWRGESEYNEMLQPLVDDLVERGIALKSRGAIVVPFQVNEKLSETPFMIQKSDGTFLYATTDIATVKYRVEVLGAEWLIYVVDKRQALHFEQLFGTAELMGTKAQLDHVGFGMMLGADGRPFRTREGDVVQLSDLIAEAEERLLLTVRAKWPESSEEEAREIARRVGIGAIKYSDLSLNLVSDYKFDWDRMLEAEGNTGPYLQYTLVRLRSVFRVYRERSGHRYTPRGIGVRLEALEELRLAKVLTRFHEVLERCARRLTPHALCDYLYTLAREFNSFYGAHQILPSSTEDWNEAVESRLMLCLVTKRTLETGLRCLNIPLVSRM